MIVSDIDTEFLSCVVVIIHLVFTERDFSIIALPPSMVSGNFGEWLNFE
jgi:hypothetical protein